MDPIGNGLTPSLPNTSRGLVFGWYVLGVQRPTKTRCWEAYGKGPTRCLEALFQDGIV